MNPNRIINYDTINSNKVSNNAFNTIIPLNQSLSKIKKVYLRSIELAPITNFRAPYNTFHYSITFALFSANPIVTRYSFTMPEKNYTSIAAFLIDLNAAIVINVQPRMGSNETAPIFSLSTTDSNKISLTYSYVSSTITFHDEGILFYYLGRGLFTTPVVTGSATKTLTMNFLYYYNLNFDSYVNLYFSNISSINKNNNNMPCDFKIIMMGNSLSYSFNNEISCNQYIEITNVECLNSLNVSIFDRYNNLLFSIHDFSFTLEYQF